MRRTMSAVMLMTLFAAAHAAAQQRQIRGQVMSGPPERPLSDAVIQTVGAQFSALSNADGGFVISAPAGDVTLRVYLIGYKTAEVIVPAGQTSAQITLDTDVLNIAGVVVTGRATTVARRNLANAVSTVVATEMERAPAESLEKQIQAKVAGAQIETNSGAPGGGIQVRLRGISTINGLSEPLYVVDGVIVSNAAIPSNQNAITAASGGSNPSLTQDAVVNRIVDLNPADIERIEILKGAAAAAIYGSKASNGVIVITTKSGRPGEIRYSFTQRLGFFDLRKKLGFREFETVDEAVAAFGESARDSYQSGRTFDQEELLAGRNDLSWESAFSISGGNAQTRYFASGLLKDDAGIVDHTGFEKQGIRLNLQQTLGGRGNLAINTAVNHTLAERGITNNDNSGTSYYMVFPFTPNFVDLRKQADGTYPDNPFERSNPLETAALVENQEDVWRITSAANFDWELYNTGTSKLEFRANGGVDYFTQENEIFSPPELQFEENATTDGFVGASLLSNSDNLKLNVSANLVHGYTPAGGSVSATTSAGIQYEDDDLNISRIVSQNLIAGQPNVNAGTVVGVNEIRQRVKDFGLYVQEELLLLDERLLVAGGIRADRSSANGDVDKFFWFPKAAASYRFSEVGPWIDEVKLRAAWGQSGNRPLFGQKFTPLTGTNNIEGLPGLVVQGTAGAADLKPERQSEIEAGVDLTLFGGNASVEATVYQKNITDLLLQRTLAPSSGFTTQIFNGGELRVRGLELAVGATPLSRGRVSWITRGTFFLDRSEVQDLPVPSFRTGGFGTSLGSYEIEVGKSATQIVTNLGLNPDGSQKVGPIGDANPDFKLSWSNEITAGDFTLYGLLDWQKGGKVVNLTKLLYDFGQNYFDHDDPVEPFDLGDGTILTGTKGEVRLDRWLNGDSRGYFETASYVKLRELSLSYNMPGNVIDGVFGQSVDNLRLTVSGRNLFSLQDYSGLDPEVSNFGNQPIARNIDVAPFPPSRSFWFTVEVGF